MAPKNKFTKEEIVEAAFEIAKNEGFDAITIRKVAECLGSSIAPIYVNFKTVDELLQEVVNKTLEFSKQLLLEQNTGRPFLDVGIASMRFARKYRVLYRDLILKNNKHMKYSDENAQFVIAKMQKDPELKDFNDSELKEILLKMQIVQTGLAVMIANELLPQNFDEETSIQMLNRIAEDVISASRLKKEENNC